MKKDKIKQFFKDLLHSLFDTKRLFKFAIYNWVTPLIIFIVTSLILILPSVVIYNSIEIETITNNINHIDDIISKTLSEKDYKCIVVDKKLSCEQQYNEITPVAYIDDEGNEYVYSVFVNSNKSENQQLAVGTYEVAAPHENYLIFFETSFIYRYTYRNPKTKQVEEYKVSSFYDNLEGLNFSEIYQKAQTFTTVEEKQSYLTEQANYIVLEGFKAYAFETLSIEYISNMLTYLIFMLLVALLIKGTYLLKRKKGFSFTQALKISLVASLQSIIIAIVLDIMGIEFINALGLAITVRTLYIYIKYTGSKKNTQWMDELYELTKDERFNI